MVSLIVYIPNIKKLEVKVQHKPKLHLSRCLLVSEFLFLQFSPHSDGDFTLNYNLILQITPLFH